MFNMFWTNKKIKSAEYEDLALKIAKVSSDVAILKANIEKFEVRIATSNRKKKIELEEIAEDEFTSEQEEFLAGLPAWDVERAKQMMRNAKE